MTIILDKNLPCGLCGMPAPRAVITVQQAGYGGMRNGELLAALEGRFDILVTADNDLRYQQNLTGRQLASVPVMWW